MNIRKRIAAALAALMLLGVLAGCGEQTPARQEFTFTAAVVGAPAGFDPALAAGEGEQIAVLHLYENLVRLQNREGGTDVVGGMAKTWECTDNQDGTETYTFHLRPEARWSDGKQVWAEDFVFAWQHLADAATGAPHAALLDMVAGYEAARAGDPDALGVRAVDHSTLEVVLACHCPYFLRSVCTAAATMPRRADLAGSTEAVTNGPYFPGSYEGGVLTLNARETYYDRSRLGPDTVVIRYCATAALAAELWNSGEVDFVCGLDDEEVVQEGTWALEPRPVTTVLVVNQMAAQLRRQELRQAMSLVVDRTAAAEIVGSVLCAPARGLVPDGIVTSTGAVFREAEEPLIDSSDYAAACQEAAALLERGGPNNGTVQVDLVYENTVTNGRVAELAADAWREQLGLEVTLRGVDSEELWDTLRREEFTVAMLECTADRNDAVAFLGMWESGHPDNVANLHSNAYDILLRVAAASSSAEARDAYLADAERLLVEQGSVIPLYTFSRGYALRSGLTGLLSDGLGVFSFSGVRTAA